MGCSASAQSEGPKLIPSEDKREPGEKVGWANLKLIQKWSMYTVAQALLRNHKEHKKLDEELKKARKSIEGFEPLKEQAHDGNKEAMKTLEEQNELIRQQIATLRSKRLALFQNEDGEALVDDHTERYNIIKYHDAVADHLQQDLEDDKQKHMDQLAKRREARTEAKTQAASLPVVVQKTREAAGGDIEEPAAAPEEAVAEPAAALEEAVAKPAAAE